MCGDLFFRTNTVLAVVPKTKTEIRRGKTEIRTRRGRGASTMMTKKEKTKSTRAAVPRNTRVPALPARIRVLVPVPGMSAPASKS